jgi:L-serine kinase (ADP)
VTRAPEFRLVPVKSLHPHEEIDQGDVELLVRQIRTQGLVQEPIWVAADTGVILNGHHRYWALRELGARWIPVWEVDYFDPAMEVGRWNPGPRPEKEDVIRRAREGRLFPPKTTRHVWHGPAPAPHPTTLPELQAEGPESGSLSVRRERAPPDGGR